jgi:hypothetical protein
LKVESVEKLKKLLSVFVNGRRITTTRSHHE